jgi:hypothetical protein
VKLFSQNFKTFPKRALFITAFGIIGAILLLATRAATPFTSIELGGNSVTPPVTIIPDSSASGGSAVQFGGGTVTPPSMMPTPANTGPTTSPTATLTAANFISSRKCENQRITDTVYIYGITGHEGATFTLKNCIVDAGWFWGEDSYSYPLSQYPTVNMNNVTINSSFAWGLAFKGAWDRVKVTNGWQLAACNDCALTQYGVTRDLPFTVTNSYIAAPPLPSSTGCEYHSEAFHGIGGAGKYVFINTRFVQEGTGQDPFQYCHTGTIYQQGGGGVIYDGCYFDDGSPNNEATYFHNINIDGSGPYASQNIVKNSYIERAAGVYIINSGGGVMAQSMNNFDFNTRQPIP